MKYALVLCLALTGCSIKGVNTTLFLKQTDDKLYNLKGEDCIISGYQIMHTFVGDTYRLTTFYSNCSVNSERILEEFELHDWAIEKKGTKHAIDTN